mmetsp:Transcript_1980/g.3052  ORF Transcript_1980/g.3052 Transcript_1980/m.3052 type:complete len:224 (-) Transcript_1980:562-1233(-)
MILVNLRKLCLRILRGKSESKLAHPSCELMDVNLIVVVRVDVVKDLVDVSKPEHVEQERVKLFLLDEVIFGVAIQLDCLLVSPHQRLLVVEPIGPQAALHHVDHQSVDFSEANHVVAIPIKLPPELLEAIGIHQPVMRKVLLDLNSEQNKHIVGGLCNRAFDVGIRVPVSIVTAAHPRACTLCRIRYGGAVVTNEGIATSTIIYPLADHPPGLACMEQVYRGC